MSLLDISTPTQHSLLEGLMRALTSLDGDEIRRHLKKIPDVNAALGEHGYTGTALHYAASHGTPEMVSILLEHGADIYILTKDNKSAMDLACEARRWANFDLLCREPDEIVQRSLSGTRGRQARKPKPYPSKLVAETLSRWDAYMRNVPLKDFEDAVQRTRQLRQDGRLGEVIPYDDENSHLIGLFQDMTSVSTSLYNQRKHAPRTIAYVTHWLGQCLQCHRACLLRPLSRVLWPPLPKRVVDVSLADTPGRLVRVVDGSNMRAAYCALSYRWGKDPIVLCTETLELFSQGVSVSMFQNQIQDAMLAASRLGIQYLWVDALCIIQGEAGDWDEEAPKMASIYENATLTFAMVDDVPMFAPQPQQTEARNSTGGSLYTRGWAFQEALMSRRVVEVTRSGLVWSCLEGTMSEGLPATANSSQFGFYYVDRQTLKKYVSQHVGSDGGHSHAAVELSAADRAKVEWLWRKVVVEEYSGKEFTFERDKTVAAAGVENRFGTILDDACLVGVWKKNAVRSLIWHVRDPSHNRPEAFIVPSWSWYSVCSPVSCGFVDPFTYDSRAGAQMLIREDFAAEAEVLEFNVESGSTSGISSHFKGSIKIRGTLLEGFAVGPGRIFLPRRRGAQAKFAKHLSSGDLAQVPYDSHDPSHVFVWEPFFPDLHRNLGPLEHKEVRCLVLGRGGYSGCNMFCYTALVLESTDRADEYRRVGLCSINPRQICADQYCGRRKRRIQVPRQCNKHTDCMGSVRTINIV